MKKVKVVIERASDGSYSAYGEKVDGIAGMGKTPEEAKASALEGLRLFLEHSSSKQIPKDLKGEYEIIFRFDTASLLNYYRGVLTNAAFERLTGINQRRLQHYSTGERKPSPEQAKKIERALHKLGAELMTVEL